MTPHRPRSAVSVDLPGDLVAEVSGRVGPGGVSTYVTAAVEQALAGDRTADAQTPPAEPAAAPAGGEGPATGQSLFLGLDLAWGTSRRTGLAVVDDAGRYLASGTATTDDDIAAWVSRQRGAVVVAAVDAPLVVPNATGQRVGERELAKDFARYGAGPHSSNRSRAWFDPPRAATLAERFEWDIDPERTGSADQPTCIEVYPHPAMVGLFGLPRRILYKKGTDRAAGFAQLVHHLERLDALRLPEHARWAELRRIVADPGRGDLERIEDELDAILCAHLAWLWHHRPGVLRIYGSLQAGYIVSPPPPHARGVASGRSG